MCIAKIINLRINKGVRLMKIRCKFIMLMNNQMVLSIIVCCLLWCINANCFSQVSKTTTGFPGKIIFNGIHPRDKNDYKRIYAASWSDGTIEIKAISPDNMPVASPIVNSKLANKIVFRSAKLYTATINENEIQLTKSLEFNKDIPFFYQGTLSPDGNKILFSRENRSNKDQTPLQDIYVFDILSGKTYQLTSTMYNVCPAWSPDGSKIAFYCGEEWISGQDYYPKDAKGFNLAVMNSDGSNLKEIVIGSYLFQVYRDFPPQWSPDGNSILFDHRPVLEPDTEPYTGIRVQSDLYIVHPDGSGLKLLRKNKGHYSWSPDGSKIAVAVNYPSTRETGPKVGINIIDADGENEQVLLGSEHWANKPIWSPDGKWIMYQEHGICLIHKATKNIIENITGVIGAQFDPVWLP
jgi:Tol biopolymer transport system component